MLKFGVKGEECIFGFPPPMYIQLLQHIEKFISLSEAERDVIAKQVQVIPICKKDSLLKEGQVCRKLFFVESGCLRLFFVNDKGIEQTTQFALEGWWLTDQSSLDRQSPSIFNIVAVENSTVVTLEVSAQEALLAAVPGMERYFRIIAQRAYAALQFRIKLLHDLSKEESYRQFATAFPGFVQRIPQYMLASYLGLTPEYLSENRKKY